MTRQETGRIMDVLRAAYPQFYSRMGEEQLRGVVNLWAGMFADDDVTTVAAAVKALIASDTRGFPPVVGQVRESIRRLTQPGRMTEAEAWNRVVRALRNGVYGSADEFERLPETLRRLVGSPAQLREWAMLDSGELQTVVQSNFMRSYRARISDEERELSMPPDVRRLARRAAGEMRLPRAGDDGVGASGEGGADGAPGAGRGR
jgi:hypothetical protein